MNIWRCLAVLWGGLVVLTVGFAVLVAFQVLFSALGDLSGARLLGGVAVGCLVLLVTDLILLVGLLGWRALQEPDVPRQADDPPDDSLE